MQERRLEAGLSLNALAEKAEVSKSYLWRLEKGDGPARPSGRTLYRIAAALGTTMSDLMGRSLLVDVPQDVPDSLRTFAEEQGLTDADVSMLSAVNFRGSQPRERDDWMLVWQAIKSASVRR
ncbi:helix-turn-helix transcriptional regulator [Pseudonocardia sp.]|uniref:helix-turn-helix domain-containing protein n=1 Tax=Pseudonocardia sp. TaxID=60912 RepID=UPI0031FD2716